MFKEFPCAKFGEKSDYSGYNRDEWQHRTHKEHLQYVSQVMAANTATERDELGSMECDIQNFYGYRILTSLSFT